MIGPHDRATSIPPRTLGWIGTTALAIAGSNASVFIVGTLFIGQGTIPGQSSAAIPLLIVGMLLAWISAPGWTELVLLRPDRVGGIAAGCLEAFRPYSSILSALAGGCYWWGWVPQCALSAIISASAIHQWLLPAIPTFAIALTIVCTFGAISMGSMQLVVRFAIPIAGISAATAFLSGFIPILTGKVDWHQATAFHLTTPFSGQFGSLTSIMAGLYLVGWAAPAFEAALCHVGEMMDPYRNVPRTILASGAIAGLYGIVLPVVWLGVLGPVALGGDLAVSLGPVFAPVFGSLAKAMAIGFITFNMFSGALQPLSGASRTLSQLSQDGVFPRFLGRRSKNGTPWAATLVTTGVAVALLFIGAPIWLLAASNFTYLLAICLASVAVWILRRDSPELERRYRAPRGTIALGLCAAVVWCLAAVFGFQQFGLSTVVVGLVFAYSGAALYGWRKLEDRHLRGTSKAKYLHLKLSGVMVTVLFLDGAGYYLAIASIPKVEAGMVAALQDIFVVVAMMTIGVGLVLPGMVAHAATRELELVNDSLRSGTEALEVEVSERQLAQERLLHVVSHDALTGLPNRSAFIDRLGQLGARSQVRGENVAAVLLVALDRFKTVNDSLGYAAGNLMLVQVARRLEQCLRRGDTLARLGGDEFMVLLEDVGSEHDAVASAQRMLSALKAPFLIMERDVFVSASIGITTAVPGLDLPEDLLRNAHIAMHYAKRTGKGRYAVFTAELLERSVASLMLEHDLQSALDRDEFVLLYQPIVSLQSGKLNGFEALIRWQHPQRGLLSPDTFIPVAEESDLILQLGAWVIGEACRQARIWKDSYGAGKDIAISVNVSAKQISMLGVLDQIRTALALYRLTSSDIHLEITESAIMHNSDVALATLVELKNLGFEVHLDDFGTGYSSLAYLQQFPIDTLKIDRSFISAGDGTGIRNPEIVAAIATLAHRLSMKTVAEGVETREQYDKLRAMGCTNAQGYYLSRPVSAREAGAIIVGPPLRSEMHAKEHLRIKTA